MAYLIRSELSSGNMILLFQGGESLGRQLFEGDNISKELKSADKINYFWIVQTSLDNLL